MAQALENRLDRSVHHRSCITFCLGFVCSYLLSYGFDGFGGTKAVSDVSVPQIISNKEVDGTNNVDREFIRSHFNTYDIKTELRSLVSTWTMVSNQHFDFAVDAVTKINANGIEGDVVECGVWKGGMSMAMVLANQKNNIKRKFWLFDTFDGLPPPDSVKDDLRAKKIYSLLQKNNTEDAPEIKYRKGTRSIEDGKWNLGPLDTVKHNMYYTGYPTDHFYFIKGKVEDTLYDDKITLPSKISILRIDTDWYESTKAELDVLWDRLQSGGVLIVDDYYSWQGARTAVNEFFTDKLGLDATVIGKNGLFSFWKP